ncbi:MAG: putative GCN5-related N-acetyltransferase, partial [Anaerolineales bacterium]|nr:putative GCN5-related N-acetyltransferase [Anaerolineales bacterium]
DAETLERYVRVLKEGLSFGAYEGHQLVGIALAEPRRWNQSLWVWEFHIAESFRGQGIGRKLMDTLAGKGQAVGLRTIVCETQNTNVPAIEFYRKVGFTMEGIDLSYYTNDDMLNGEVAIFMKRRLT